MSDKIDAATNRLTLGYDVPSMGELLRQWAVLMSNINGGDPQEWVKALADEMLTPPGDE